VEVNLVVGRSGAGEAPLEVGPHFVGIVDCNYHPQTVETARRSVDDCG
jgi:hypothetical protein